MPSKTSNVRAPAPELPRDDWGNRIMGNGLVDANISVPWPRAGPEGARLYMKLTVTMEDAYQGSRLCYTGDLFLSSHIHKIGHIIGFRVVKRSASRPDWQNKRWINDWLSPRPSTYGNSDMEMMYAMRSLYKNDGTPRFTGDEGLNHVDDLIFIQSVHIKKKYAGRGFLKHAFSLYYQSFTATSIQEQYRVHGTLTFVLEPGLPDGNTQWDHLRLQFRTENDFFNEVASQLETIYRKPSNGYEVLTRDFPIGKAVHTILGYRVKATPASPSQPLGTIEHLLRHQAPTSSHKQPSVILGTPIKSHKRKPDSDGEEDDEGEQDEEGSDGEHEDDDDDDDGGDIDRRRRASKRKKPQDLTRGDQKTPGRKRRKLCGG